MLSGPESAVDGIELEEFWGGGYTPHHPKDDASDAESMDIRLDTPVQYIRRVGPARAQVLAKAGIHVVGDLLRHVPYRYEDRTRFKSIRDLRIDEETSIQGAVIRVDRKTTSIRRLLIFQVEVEDESGRLLLKFFNTPHLDRVLAAGRQVIVYGTVRADEYSGGLTMINPDFELLGGEGEEGVHTGRVVPIHRKISSLTPRMVRQVIFEALTVLKDEPELLPTSSLSRYVFPPSSQAWWGVHFPECPEDKNPQTYLEDLQERRTPAFHRLIYEEFFVFQLGIQLMRWDRRRAAKKHRIQVDAAVRRRLKSVLPFRPTQAQKRVLKEIVDDLTASTVMSRLLQGDVGSGKTIVALQAMLVVMENGHQAVLMAPTEILAEQHQKNLSRLLEKTPFRTAFLSGRIKGKARAETLSRIAEGQVQLIIGTHALIEKAVEFSRLGIIVVDEQHRFGVMQRSRLMEKAQRPDVLVMTATPIPRSLALTLYGDLDLSVIDELPPGRRPIQTVIQGEKNREALYRGLHRQLDQGRQIYVVYPLIEESEKLDVKAAVEMAEHLQQDVFPQFRVGLLHGRLKSDEKERLMSEFASGRIQVLVSTTVIEVGIDVPNATVMVIENAERFGLSQLHQLRGRIGRGEHESYCVLMVSKNVGDDARERLKIMRSTDDGFKIAEKDLELRGPGEFVGTKQSGLPEFRFGNIVRDRSWLELARRDAAECLKRREDGESEARAVIDGLMRRFQGRFDLHRVG